MSGWLTVGEASAEESVGETTEGRRGQAQEGTAENA